MASRGSRSGGKTRYAAPGEMARRFGVRAVERDRNAERASVAAPKRRTSDNQTILIFGSVEGSYERVAILGFGPSMRCLTKHDVQRLIDHGVAVIAVNRAALHWPATHFFTLDCSPINRSILRCRPLGENATYYAAVPDDYGLARARVASHRHPPEPGVVYLQRESGKGPLKSKAGLSSDPGVINTGNSAWGALQVARFLNPRFICLFGVDGSHHGYAFGPGGPATPLNHLPLLFASSAEQFRREGVGILNASPTSILTCFPKTTPPVGVQWLLG